ncbi:MAG: gliding motility-associated C-terminal domain-containing protein [Ferruginibacter sp.]
MKQFLLSVICFCCFATVFSQINRNKTWYFGEYVGLDFNSGAPVVLGNSAMNQDEGCASISDLNGNILFYTDGRKVWNRNHQVMLNGTGLTGGYSSTQSALIVPMPLDNNIFYVFTVPAQSTTVPLSYSIIDMSLDAGSGAVTLKNVPLYGPVGEKLTGTLKSNGIDYWIVAKGFGNDVFVSYSLTAAGLNSVPVISHAGSIFSASSDAIGYLRISPNGSKLCVAYHFAGISQLFDFDINTGIVSNPIDLHVEMSYGVAFSPDNSKLYIMKSGLACIIWQYNLLAGSPIDIQNSAYIVAQPIVNPGYVEYGAAIALGPDEKIYACYYHRRHLAIINDPDLTGAACNYVHLGIYISSAPNSKNGLGLPNQIYYPPEIPCPVASQLTYDISICSNQSYQLPSGAVVNTAGVYLDTIKNQMGTCDSITYTINLSVFDVVQVDTAVHICPGNSYKLPSGVIVSNEGTYLDTLRNQASCDSIIYIIQLDIDDISYTNIIDSFFTGQTYTLPSGIKVSSAGKYLSIFTNSVGCDSIVTVTLKEKTLSDCLIIKNAFTPNGDGINDNWILYRYRCFKRLTVNVYNRYGSLVYHTDDYKNDWNGRYMNKDLPDATYYFVLRTTSFNDKQQEIKGDVTILR